MNVLAATLRQHMRIVRSYPGAMSVITVVAALVLHLGWKGHDLLHAVAYLVAVWFGMFATDVVVNLRPCAAIGFPMKNSAWREVAVIAVCIALAFVFLFIHFSALWSEMSRGARLALMPLVLFTYPIVLAMVYFFYFQYRPRELGVNAHYWYLAIVMHLIVGGTAWLVCRDNFRWHEALHEFGGVFGMLFIGLVCAALSEEFTRMLLQTRLGAALKNKPVAFLVASFVWASMHSPSAQAGHPSMPFVQVLLGSWTIAPIGFLWGYMTHRTKSLLPAVLVHGLNMWGLQSFYL